VDYYAYFLWSEEKNGMELKHSFGLREGLEIGSVVPWALLKRPEDDDKKWKLASIDLIKTIFNGENINLKSDSIILEPLLSEGRVSGLIFLGNKENHSYTEEEKQFIAIISSQIVGIYERFKTLIRYSNLATMGELTAGIAHDLKRPLSSISGMMYFLETRWEDREFCEETLETLKMELSRLTELTHQLSRFSSPQEFSRESRNPKEVFDHVLRLVTSEAEKKDIKIITDYDPSQTQVMINFNQMVEAQINIISNAFQAMPSGGTLKIITNLMSEDQVTPEEAEAPGRKRLQNEKFMRIAVSDTGVGIPKDHLNKIFNRFFTTKTSGTGLGLMITKRIIEAMGGTIFYTSKVDKGTTCFIELPAIVSLSPDEPGIIPAAVQQP
jgi:signal transduction histidine kinase